MEILGEEVRNIILGFLFAPLLVLATPSSPIIWGPGATAKNLATGGLLNPDGTVGAPGFSFTSETTSGLYRVGTNDLGVAINGAQALDVTAGVLTLKAEMHLKSVGTAPTATVNANAGTGATCSVANASDIAGTINLVTTAVSPGTGEQCKVNFNASYGVAPVCLIQGISAVTIAQAVLAQEYVTTNSVKLSVNFGASDATGHTYSWMYHCIETQ